jgi:hypothetical protein
MTAVYFENHSKLIYTCAEKNAQLFNVKAGGTYSYHCALKDEISSYIGLLGFALLKML